LFVVVCAANLLAIFFACLPMSRPFKILFVIAGFFLSFGTIGSLIGLSFEIMRSGVGAMMSGRDFWIGTATALGIGLMIAGLFFVLSVAMITPPSANRALPVRLYITGIWLLGGILSFCWVTQTGDAERMYAWTVPTFVLMLCALLVTVSNTDHLSLRVRRTIPQRPLQRFLGFFFFNRTADGLLWMGGILDATWAVTDAMSLYFPSPSTTPFTAEKWYGTTVVYAFAYALTALFIHRKFLPLRPAKLTGLLTVLLAGGWAIAPSIFLFFANQLSWKSVDGLQLGNIFNIFSLRDDEQIRFHQVFASAWLMVMVIVNVRWFRRQVLNFQPSAPAAPAAAGGPPPLPPLPQ